MARNKATMGTDSARHPGIKSCVSTLQTSMQQMVTSSPMPPPQVNTAILAEPCRERYQTPSQARLANLTDAIVGNEGCNSRRRSPTPSRIERATAG